MHILFIAEAAAATIGSNGNGPLIGILGTILTGAGGVITFFVKSWLSDMKLEVQRQRADFQAEMKTMRSEFTTEMRRLAVEQATNTRATIVALMKIPDLVAENRELLESSKKEIDDRMKRDAPASS